MAPYSMHEGKCYYPGSFSSPQGFLYYQIVIALYTCEYYVAVNEQILYKWICHKAKQEDTMPSLFQKCIGQQKKQPCLIFITTVFFTKKTPSLISFRNVFVTNIKQKHHVWYLLQMYWSHKSKETTKSGLFQKNICLKDQKKTPRLVFFRNILVTKVKRKHHVWSLLCKQRVCFPPLLLVQVAHTSNENFHQHHHVKILTIVQL